MSGDGIIDKARRMLGIGVPAATAMRMEELGESYRRGFNNGEAAAREETRKTAKNPNHIAHFLRLKCAGDLLNSGVYPNIKELTEAMGAYDAMFRLRDMPNLDDDLVQAIVIGDGTTPRVGAMLAFRTKWYVTSVDPNMHPRDFHVKRLQTRRQRIEDATGLQVFGARHIMVFAIHSHGPLRLTKQQIPDGAERISVIAMPCCKPQLWDNKVPPDFKYRDRGVWSPKNEIHIWNSVSLC